MIYLLPTDLKKYYNWFPENSEIYFAENFKGIKENLLKNKFDIVFLKNIDNKDIHYLLENFKFTLYVIDTQTAEKLNEDILANPFLLTYSNPDSKIKLQLSIINLQKYKNLLHCKNNNDGNYNDFLTRKLIQDDNIFKDQKNIELATRLIGLGEITAFIIHDLKQPLTAILNYIELSIRRIDQTEKILGYLRKSNIQVIRMSEMINNLHRYLQKSIITLVDINQIILEVIELLRQRFNIHNIKLETDLSPDLPPIMGDYNQLMQVYLNLINNAFDALTSCNKSEKTLLIHTYFSEEDQSIISEITDNGPGIPADMQDRVFDMFVTTKQEGKGTGLGLYITQKILKTHSAKIDLYSKPGECTTFLLSFPVNNTVRTAG